MEHAPESPAEYLSIREIAEVLGRSSNTVKHWISEGLFPDPDAALGGPNTRNGRLWNKDRFLALLLDDSENTPYEWSQEPKHYLTIPGIAALIKVPLNTVRWWSQRDTRRTPRWTYEKVGAQDVTLPPRDITSSWASGWTTETVWHWWNNTYPAQVGPVNNRYRSAPFTRYTGTKKVAIIDTSPHDGDNSLQVRPAADGDSIDYLPAATALDAATTDGSDVLADATAGCWFIPDLSTLGTTDQKKVIIAFSRAARPSVILADDPDTLPAGTADRKRYVTVLDADALDAIFEEEKANRPALAL